MAIFGYPFPLLLPFSPLRINLSPEKSATNSIREARRERGEGDSGEGKLTWLWTKWKRKRGGDRNEKAFGDEQQERERYGDDRGDGASGVLKFAPMFCLFILKRSTNSEDNLGRGRKGPSLGQQRKGMGLWEEQGKCQSGVSLGAGGHAHAAFPFPPSPTHSLDRFSL